MLQSALRVEKRLNDIQNELRAEYQVLQEKHGKEEIDNISAELKQVGLIDLHILFLLNFF